MTPAIGYAGRCDRRRLAALRCTGRCGGRVADRSSSAAWQESSSFQRPSPDCVGPTLARLAGSVKRFVSLRPTSRLSPPSAKRPTFSKILL